MLADSSVIPLVMGRLSGSDFYDPKNAAVFSAIVQNSEDSATPDEPIAVTRRLLDGGDLYRVGGAPYLHDLQAVGAPAESVPYYADIVAQAAYARRVREAADRVSRATESGNAERVATELAALADLRPSGMAMVGAPPPWSPVDLEPYLSGRVVRASPSIGLARNDGLRLLYPGKEHAVIGEMECGKGWFCVACAAVELMAGNTVVYIHYEEADPSDTIDRLLTLGVPAWVIEKRFIFVAPDRPVTAEGLSRLLDPLPSLVIHDGVNEAMSLHGWGIREEDGAAAFRRHLVLPCLRLGVATLAADHVVKDVERRGRNALGSIHKGNGLSGALIMLENAEPFGRSARGRSRVFVTKDRPGHLRQHGAPTKVPGKTYMGELVVDDTRLRKPGLELAFIGPTGDTAPALSDPTDDVDEHVMRTVVELAASGSEVNVGKVRATSKYGTDKTADALTRLVIGGRLVEQRGPRNARLSFLDVPGGAANRCASCDDGLYCLVRALYDACREWSGYGIEACHWQGIDGGRYGGRVPVQSGQPADGSTG
jgi:hypothetical protein